MSRRQATPQDRRTTRRGPDPVLLLSLLIPLLTVGVLLTVHPAPTEEGPRSPEAAPLSVTVRVCPPALAGASQVAATLADPQLAGALQASGGDDDLAVSPGQVATRRTPRALTLTGRDSMAAGLVVARSGAGAGSDCREPRSDVWFAGVGAGPEHASVLTLSNPDAGPALADVRVLAARGDVEVARLRGVAVEPRGQLSLPLAELAPERDDVSLRVTVSRGRLASWVTDQVAPLGGDDRAQAWLPPATAPARDVVLPGVARGGGDRVLVLTNEGEGQARVDVLAVTPESEFAPTQLKPVQVPPGSTVTVGLGRFLGSPAAGDVMALRLRASEPVTGVLRTRVGSQMTHAVATEPLRHRGAVLVEPGAKRLVLAGPAEEGEVKVLQRAAGGRVLPERRVQLLPGRGAAVPLSPQARYVEVVVDGLDVAAAVQSTDGFAWVRPVGELLTESWVPHVAPALY